MPIIGATIMSINKTCIMKNDYYCAISVATVFTASPLVRFLP